MVVCLCVFLGGGVARAVLGASSTGGGGASSSASAGWLAVSSSMYAVLLLNVLVGAGGWGGPQERGVCWRHCAVDHVSPADSGAAM